MSDLFYEDDLAWHKHAVAARENAMRKVYWMGPVPDVDDFGKTIDDQFIDGKTNMGPWAIMTPSSWRLNGVGQLGLGRGQRYERQADDRWLKVEG